MVRRLLSGAVLAAALSLAPEASALQPKGFWQKSFKSFVNQDKKRPPAKGGVVFVGSSSIRLWQTRAFFPRLPAVNRGLGGAQIDDIERFVEPLVLTYEPKVIVFYAGENDIGAGATPERVLSEFRAFLGLVRPRLPEARVVFISIKPSVALRPLWPKAREANRLIEDLCGGDPRLRYVDVATSMLGPHGKPRKELFQEDGLHMTAIGYRLWTHLVSPVVEAALAEP